jgi:Zn-dependent peptidase ImmA (M78 family)
VKTEKGLETRTTFDVIDERSRSAPVDVEAIARDLGIKIYRESLEPGVYGKLARDPRSASGYSIYVNSSDSRLRQRFTIAHEIAHFVLHRDLVDSEIVDRQLYRSHLGNKYESQANRFAAGLIMPSELVAEAFQKLSRDPAVLARKFQVSTVAMRIRLESLGLLPKTLNTPSSDKDATR